MNATLLLNFFYMDGYGFYVWTAYGSVLVFLLIQWFIPWRRWQNYLRGRNDKQHE